MTIKHVAVASGGVALLAVLVLGLLQLTGRSQTPAPRSTLTLAQMRTALAGSPATLAALHAQAGTLLPGGLGALRVRLRKLRGQPIVINKWASWCVPCRTELGAFQHVSVTHGREVAFIGIDSGDTSRADALAFLRSFPVSYPSYYDRSGRAGLAITDSSFTPVTVFYDRHGGQFIHQGPYPSVATLERDIRRYAFDHA
ncbi:MAG TPA: TlpA disulfide reductase family protein [Solirubrobacteraceae bacterium]|jgi:thiol-disulfide isomerase/thioredoxin